MLGPINTLSPYVALLKDQESFSDAVAQTIPGPALSTVPRDGLVPPLVALGSKGESRQWVRGTCFGVDHQDVQGPNAEK